MAWRYRRRLRLARGLYLNVGKTGATSLSLGVRGARLTLGRRGKRATIGLPGSGLSYTAYEPYHGKSAAPDATGRQGSGQMENPPPSTPRANTIKVLGLVAAIVLGLVLVRQAEGPTTPTTRAWSPGESTIVETITPDGVHTMGPRSDPDRSSYPKQEKPRLDIAKPVYLAKDAVACPQLTLGIHYANGQQAGGEAEGHRVVADLFDHPHDGCWRVTKRTRVRVLDAAISDAKLVDIDDSTELPCLLGAKCHWEVRPWDLENADDERSPDLLPKSKSGVAQRKTVSPQTDVARGAQKPVVPKTAMVEPSERNNRGELLTLIRGQISRCWNVPAGARDAKDLVVEIRVIVDRDGAVQQATIVDQGRLGSDPFFRAAAESARRAFFNPLCRPLHLPAEKYAIWKDLVVDFSPKDIL